MTHDEKIEAALAQLKELQLRQNEYLLKLLDLLEKPKPAPKSKDQVELPSKKAGSHLYSTHEIIMLSGEGNYTRVLMKKDNELKEILLSHNLGYWEMIFDSFGFLRLHKCHLVNPEFVIDFSGSSHYLELPFGLSFTVTRDYIETAHVYFHSNNHRDDNTDSLNG